ncbi:hypothetical protein [Paraburkholderia terrae]|uniref:hypothetical protein n=1 Tax=Paraburkholderia terrae TaxID=311230 RepID=UPI001EE23AE8|nr:hypothetical protein [Paraburkholderia terrae]GJH05028.1 hypothetical protein CBA19C8_30745 [Paraburkholderia terrae]
MAETQNQEDKAEKKAVVKGTKVRVLVSCEHGEPNDVVVLDAETIKAAKQHGAIDDDAAAVKYAESLKKE